MPNQISVFLQDQPGHLDRVMSVLAEKGVNIRAMTLTTTTSGWGVLNLLVDDPRTGRDALREAGLSVALRPIVVAVMGDSPGGLHRTLSRLADAGVNVQNAYATILDRGESAILVIDADDPKRVETVLNAAEIRTMTEQEVANI